MMKRRILMALGAVGLVVGLASCHSTNVQIRADWNPDGAFAYDNDLAAGGVGLGFNCGASPGANHTYVEWEGWKPPTAGEIWTSPPIQCPNWAPYILAGTVTHWQWH